MKRIIIITTMLFATTTYGQTIAKDSILIVINDTPTDKVQKTAFFINGKFVDNSLETTLAPEFIDSIYFVLQSVEVDGNLYNTRHYIKTKKGYNPKLISLTTFKGKFTNLNGKPALFMINGNVVNADYDKYIIDENYVLQMVVDNIKNEKEKINMLLINLMTKSKENIKKLEMPELSKGWGGLFCYVPY